MNYPPAKRSSAGLGLLRGVAEGRLRLQRCAECGTVLYPPRDACPGCLGAELPWTQVADGGRVLATTAVRVSTEQFFRERLPWHVGLVLADCGPRIVAHLSPELAAEQRVRVEPRVDPGGRPVLVATGPATPVPSPLDEFPRIDGPQASVTDPDSELGRAVDAALRARGIDVLTGPDAEAAPVLDTRP